jgi:hypothetical protein
MNRVGEQRTHPESELLAYKQRYTEKQHKQGSRLSAVAGLACGTLENFRAAKQVSAFSD